MDVVNDTLKRTGVIQGATTDLGTSTGGTASEVFLARSDIQHPVDLILQMWREAAHVVYELAPAQNLIATATITLVANQRDYDLPSDFERFAGQDAESRVMRGATNNFILKEYSGGFLRMLADQPTASDWTGNPQAWAISPSALSIRIDREPSTSGDTYYLPYEKRIDLTATMATATMPFSDTVAHALIPVVAEFYERTRKKDFDAGIFRTSLQRAVAMAQGTPPNNRYGKRRAY